jgi:hypothetical protein
VQITRPERLPWQRFTDWIVPPAQAWTVFGDGDAGIAFQPFDAGDSVDVDPFSGAGVAAAGGQAGPSTHNGNRTSHLAEVWRSREDAPNGCHVEREQSHAVHRLGLKSLEKSNRR